MLHFNFYDLSRIPDCYVTHTELSAICTDACDSAQNPKAKIKQCPWNKACTRRNQYKRLIWRSVFRRTQEARLELVAKINQITRYEVAA